MENKINENTDLILNPNAKKDSSIKELSTEMASLGSQYKDLLVSVNSLKELTNSLQSYQTKLNTNMTLIIVCYIIK